MIPEYSHGVEIVGQSVKGILKTVLKPVSLSDSFYLIAYVLMEIKSCI